MPQDIAPALAVLMNKAHALYVVSDAPIAANRAHIIRFALSEHLPLTYADYVEPVLLWIELRDVFRRAADMVDKILHGTKPGDYPG